MSQLLEHERIKTTLPKAKELRRLADKMVSLGKKGTLHSKRQAERVVRGKQVMEKLFGEMAERYKCVANAVRVAEGTKHVKKNTSADAKCATDVACCPRGIRAENAKADTFACCMQAEGIRIRHPWPSSNSWIDQESSDLPDHRGRCSSLSLPLHCLRKWTNLPNNIMWMSQTQGCTLAFSVLQ